MGAILCESGVSFRVWAPHADAVCVVGAFNRWNPEASPLAPEEDGCWSGEIPGAAPGHAYRFVLRANGQVLSRIDPYAVELDPTTRDPIVYDPDSFDWGTQTFRMPPRDELVIYELHLGTFCGAILSLGLAPLEARLDHVAALGVNCIEIMPVTECAGYPSWGYNPWSLFAVRADYGGPHGLKSLVRAAHSRGLAVILDVVYNHMAIEDNPLWRFDGWGPAGRGGIYFYNDWRHPTPWGERFDYGRPEVRRLVRENVTWWLSEFRVDGLRWDGTAYIRNVHGYTDHPPADLEDGWRLMQDVARDIRELFPGTLHIAEDMRNNGWIVRDVEGGGAGFGAQWESEFVFPVLAVLAQPRDEWRSMAEIRRAVEHRHQDDPLRRVIYTESHDGAGRARVPKEIDPEDPQSRFAHTRSMLGAVLTFTTPGIPMLFQGQEMLDDEPFSDIRPLDWRRAQTHAHGLYFYRHLAALRRDRAGTTRGLRGPHVHVYHVNETDKALAYHRWDVGGPRDDVVVFLNFADRSYLRYEVGLPRPGRWKVRLNSGDGTYHPGSVNMGFTDVDAYGPPLHAMPVSASIPVAPYGAILLSQDD